MTEKENERQKRNTLNALHTGIRIEERFSNIEKIEIDYIMEHCSAFGVQKKEHRCVYEPHNEAYFIIPCLNRECSSIGFDLSDEIFTMWRNRQNEMSGEKKCQGQEAPDHPEQRCGSSLRYSIRINYI